MAMSAIGQNLQALTGNVDVSIWVKNSWVGTKTPNNQINQMYKLRYSQYIFVILC